jgi:hypothetical protein
MTMLDRFLEVAYQAESQRNIRNEMAEGLKNLPVDELRKIASGEIKLSGYDDDDWLCKFRGTDLYDEALALETECLELDAQQQQLNLEDNAERRERGAQRDEIWDQKDAVRLKKRLLELELRKAELAAMGGGGEVEAPVAPGPPEEEPEMEEEEPDEKDAAAYFINKRRDEVMAKFAQDSPEMQAALAQQESASKRLAESAGPPVIGLGVGTPLGALAGGIGASELGRVVAKRSPLAQAALTGAGVGLGAVGGWLCGMQLAHRFGPGYEEREAANKELQAAQKAIKAAKGKPMSEPAPVDAAQAPELDPQTAALAEKYQLDPGFVSDELGALSGYDASPDTLEHNLAFESALQKRLGGPGTAWDEKRWGKPHPEIPKGEKTASVLSEDAMQIADLWGRQMAHMEMEKEALPLAQMAQTAWKGLKGAGRALKTGVGTLREAHRLGGTKALAERSGQVGSALMRRGARFAQQNPAAAAMLGGGAALGVGGAGLAAGRASA